MNNAIRNTYMNNAGRNIYKLKDDRKYTIIIPSAGLATRMKAYGPKSLITINNKTILQRQLEWIKKNFINNEIIIIGGFKANDLFDNTPEHLIKIENERFADTNVVRSIGLGLRACNTDHVIIINGDLYFKNIKIAFPVYSSIIIAQYLMSDNEVGCIINDNNLTHIMYDLQPKWSQIMYLTGQELEIFKTMCWDKKNEKKYSFELLNDIVDLGYKINCINPKNFWCNDIDSIKDIKILKNENIINN